MVPHELPLADELHTLLADLSLRNVRVDDEEEFYLAVLQLPALLELEDGPLKLQARLSGLVQDAGRVAAWRMRAADAVGASTPATPPHKRPFPPASGSGLTSPAGVECRRQRQAKRGHSGLVYPQGAVVRGFGRGSRDMGVPTANVAPTAVEQHLVSRPFGVYFGWAQVVYRDGSRCSDVVAMVLNYGRRPTIQDGSHATVRVRLLRARRPLLLPWTLAPD